MRKQPLYPHLPKNKVLPQALPDGNGRKEAMSLGLSREQVTETTISNMIQAGALLPSEADRFRRVLDTYDNISLLKLLIFSKELREP